MQYLQHVLEYYDHIMVFKIFFIIYIAKYYHGLWIIPSENRFHIKQWFFTFLMYQYILVYWIVNFELFGKKKFTMMKTNPDHLPLIVLFFT